MRSKSARSDRFTVLAKEVREAVLPPARERKRIRQAAGVSIRDAARALGTHPMTLIRWERGEQPRRENAIAYRHLLDALRGAITR